MDPWWERREKGAMPPRAPGRRSRSLAGSASLISWPEDGGLGHDLAHRGHDPLDLGLAEPREERERQRATRHVLAHRELALAMAEALAIEAHQVDRRHVGLRVDAALAQPP